MSAAPDRDAFGRPAAGAIDLVLLTRRFDDTVRAIAGAAFAACAAHPELRLTIADGATDPAKAAWLAERCARSAGAARVVRTEDLMARVIRAVDRASAWTLFLADDDPFSLDYLDAFVRRARRAAPSTALICPGAWLSYTGDRVLVRRMEPIGAATLGERLAALYAQPTLAGTPFYALIRTPAVAAWLDHVATRPYPLSTYDLLLANLAVAWGAVERVDGFTVLVREDTTWMTPELGVRADAAFYPRPGLVLLHETLMVGDLAAMLAPLPGFAAGLPVLRERMLALLDDQFNLVELRRRVIGAEAEEFLPLLEGSAELRQWLRSTRDPEALGAGLQRVVGFCREIEQGCAAAAGS